MTRLFFHFASPEKAKATEVAFGPCDEAAGFVRLVFYI
jgi:hypothetical protein